MRLLTLIVLAVLSLQNIALAQEYPMRPDPRLTPGDICTTPVEYRYNERIAYCDRIVSTMQKEDIFNQYRRLGYRLNPQQRSSYKIDHYIPLCMGGSNDDRNLWPQHISIYNVTDSLEALACDRMKRGVLSQREAIYYIMLVKNDLRQAQNVRNAISSRY